MQSGLEHAQGAEQAQHAEDHDDAGYSADDCSDDRNDDDSGIFLHVLLFQRRCCFGMIVRLFPEASNKRKGNGSQRRVGRLRNDQEPDAAASERDGDGSDDVARVVDAAAKARERDYDARDEREDAEHGVQP